MQAKITPTSLEWKTKFPHNYIHIINNFKTSEGDSEKHTEIDLHGSFNAPING